MRSSWEKKNEILKREIIWVFLITRIYALITAGIKFLLSLLEFFNICMLFYFWFYETLPDKVILGTICRVINGKFHEFRWNEIFKLIVIF